MLLAFWEDGGWQDAAIVAAIILIAYALVMWVGALVWTYRDMQARSRDPFTQVVAVLVVLVFNLPGIMLYMVLRPKETLAELYDRQLGSEALLHEIHDQPTCPACRRKIDTDFMTCPYCRTALRVPCASCEKALMSTWVLCPYCGADRSLPAAPNIVVMRAPATAPTLAKPATPVAIDNPGSPRTLHQPAPTPPLNKPATHDRASPPLAIHQSPPTTHHSPTRYPSHMIAVSVTIDDIRNAKHPFTTIVRRTPLLPSGTLSELCAAEVRLKAENLQRTGSFKIRGAMNRLAALTDAERASGVIAASAGNHAQGVALAAKSHGVRATIVMPRTTPLAKVQATRDYGAEIILHGDAYDDAKAEAHRIATER